MQEKYNDTATVDVIIPAYRPGREFGELLHRLEEQEYRPRRILVMNTGEQYWNREWAILSKPENKGKIAYFASINNAKFKNKVVPGDTLTLEVEIIKEKGPMGVGKAKATNQDGKVAVIAELTFAVGA